MFTFVNAPHSIFFSLAIPPLKTGPKQNDAINLATLDQIKKMEEKRHNHQQHHHYHNIIMSSPGQFKTLPSQP